MKSKTALQLKQMQLGKAPLPDELWVQNSTRLTHQETSKKCLEFKYAPPFILMEYDIIVHLHWNAL